MKINQKYLLFVLGGLLILGFVFSIIQVTKAGMTGPHSPGHIWANIDKPADCPSGQFVRGANDTGWVCVSGIPIYICPEVNTPCVSDCPKDAGAAGQNFVLDTRSTCSYGRSVVYLCDTSETVNCPLLGYLIP